MTKFFNKFKKTCFWPIFPILGATKSFLENLALSCTTSVPCITSSTIPKFRKKVMQFQENGRTDRRMDGRMDGRTDLFYRTLPATAKGPINRCHLLHTTHQ